MPPALILIAGLSAYYNSFHVPFQFDDYGYSIILNKPISSISNLMGILSSYPARMICLLSFSLNLTVSPGNVIYFHIINFTIHIANGLLFYHVLRNLISRFQWRGDPDEKNIEIPAVFCAIIFVCHPVQMQAVTYISQRYTSLMTLFYLTSIYFYLLYTQHRGDVHKNAFLFLTLAFISGIFANLTKEVAVTLPLAWLLIELILVGSSPSKIAKEKWSVFLAIILLVMPFLLLLLANNPSTHDATLLQAPSTYEYLLTQIKVIAEYLRLFIVPINQNLDYDFPIQTQVADPYFVICFLIHLALLGTAFFLRRSSRIVSFGILFFYLALMPESSLFALPDVIFEHRLYLPSIGLLICAASLCGSFLVSIQKQKIATRRWLNIISALVALCMISVMIAATQYRNYIWRSRDSLWRDIVTKSPHKLRPRLQLGSIYMDMNEYAKALEQFRMAIQNEPRFSGSYNNIGIAHVRLGEIDRAIAAFEKAIAISPNNPGYWRNLGHAYQVSGRLDQAEALLSKCIDQFPDYEPCKSRLEKVMEIKQKETNDNPRRDDPPGQNRGFIPHFSKLLAINSI